MNDRHWTSGQRVKLRNLEKLRARAERWREFALREEVMLAELDVVGLSQRVVNVLDKRGMLSVEDMWKKSVEDLLSIRGLGFTELGQLYGALLRVRRVVQAREGEKWFGGSPFFRSYKDL